MIDDFPQSSKDENPLPHGFLKNNEELLILRKGTAKSAKPAKFFDFLSVLRVLSGSKFLSDTILRKHIPSRHATRKTRTNFGNENKTQNGLQYGYPNEGEDYDATF
jgi:hypothetical protein